MDAPTRVQELKAALALIFTAITALIGWQGWLVVIWVFAMVLDYITGSKAAMLAGEWSSKVAREGIWHKAGSIAVGLVAVMMDLSVHVIAQEGVGFELPWSGPIIFPVVVIWYILTEAGSILENAVECGAPCPKWFKDKIKNVKDKLDEQQSGHPPDDDSVLQIEHMASDDLDSGK